MKKTKNNKGFSLVELIVVVLILGILAVAVTPQVMKWVGKSKISADKDSANALKSAITTALADWQGVDNGKIPAAGKNPLKATIGDANTQDTTISFDATGAADWNPASGTGTVANLVKRIDEVTAKDYPVSKYDQGGFVIEIEAGTGKISVTYGAKNESD